MKLPHLCFSALQSCADQMGGAQVNIVLTSSLRPLEPLDHELQVGKAVELTEITLNEGLLSFNGRQVLLFIPNHHNKVSMALENGSTGKKYHITDCETLKKMRANNRFNQRYVATNKLGGEFDVFGFDEDSKERVEGKTDLKVCKNCLKKLNYQNYRHNKNQVFNQFSLTQFFSQYNSYFRHMPTEFHAYDINDYPENWSTISRQYRKQHHYVCEKCAVDLNQQKHLLHVHHKNAQKTDINPNNLIALCADCHRKEPFHQHMHVGHSDMQTINALRRKSQLIRNDNGYDEIMRYSDPAMKDLLFLCQRGNLPVPQVAYRVSSENNQSNLAFELAWINAKVAVVIAPKQYEWAKSEGWTILGRDAVLDDDQFREFSAKINDYVVSGLIA
jgi:5-methylcytosine-specific restriction endonuclease McrA